MILTAHLLLYCSTVATAVFYWNWTGTELSPIAPVYIPGQKFYEKFQ